MTNWRESKGPPLTKVRLLARNLTLRLVRRDTCCGHEGEPGC